MQCASTKPMFAPGADMTSWSQSSFIRSSSIALKSFQCKDNSERLWGTESWQTRWSLFAEWTVLEWLLTTGSDSLIFSKNFLSSFWQTKLGVKPNSNDNINKKIPLRFLRIIFNTNLQDVIFLLLSIICLSLSLYFFFLHRQHTDTAFAG